MTRELKNLAKGLCFLEGPRWHEGRLYASDFYLRRVMAFDEEGRGELICEVPGQPSGLGFDREGNLLISSMNDRRVARLGDDGLETVAALDHLAGGPLNDMTVDSRGRAFVGNFGSFLDQDETIHPTVLVRVDPDGSATVVAEDLVFPNGTPITPDGETMLVAESFAFRISAFDLGADGSLSNRREWARFGDPLADPTIEGVLAADALIPDGMCMDAEGAVWMADARDQGVLRVREGGEILDRIDLGEDTGYAVALGGPDGHTLFITAAPPLGQLDPAEHHRSSLWSCRVDVPGVGWA
jgi:sugar lactone lactonase YvrE